ncbi:MAG: hypothetical protein M0037_13400 [Betaproteobacteria bacterium]|nr:hypothetical protein [Betaproteobacteria bacterium]
MTAALTLLAMLASFILTASVAVAAVALFKLLLYWAAFKLKKKRAGRH